MGTSVQGKAPFSPSDVDSTKFGSGGSNVVPHTGRPAMGAVLNDLLGRISGAVANTAALQATVQADRVDGMIVLTLDTYTLWTWKNGSTTSTSGTVIEPTDTAAGSGTGRFVALSTTAQTLSQLAIQSGTLTLTSGVSGSISATVTASTRIVVTRTSANSSTTLGVLEVSNKTVGAPGHFVVTSLILGTPASTQTADASICDWIAIG